jgi:hypothetical protein
VTLPRTKRGSPVPSSLLDLETERMFGQIVFNILICRASVEDTRLKEALMAQNEDGVSTRRRSTGFPVVPLPQAADIVKKAGKYGKAHSRDAFAQYAGHSTPKSGPFRQKMAAFRDWNLVRADGELVELTDLGIRIAFPEDELSLAAALKEAFNSCELFTAIRDRSAKGTPLELEKIANNAVYQFNVAAASKTQFMKSFGESIVAAGLARRVDAASIELLGDGDLLIEGTGDPGENGSAKAASDAPASADSPRAAGGGAPRSVSGNIVLSQPWSVQGGSLLFQIELDRPLPGSAFSTLQTLYEEVQKLVDLLGVPDDGSEPRSPE